MFGITGYPTYIPPKNSNPIVYDVHNMNGRKPLGPGH